MNEKVKVPREVRRALDTLPKVKIDEDLTEMIELHAEGFETEGIKILNNMTLITFIRCLIDGYEEDSPEKEIEDLYETHYKTKLMDNISDEGKNVSRGICYAIEIMNEKFDLKLELNGATEID
ncbi:hypothetical protein SFC08_13245 [Lysinibacillus halotolerans]